MPNLSNPFWQWLGLLFVAVIVLKFVPDKARIPLIVLLILGGLMRIAYSEKDASGKPIGLNSFLSDLTNGKVQV